MSLSVMSKPMRQHFLLFFCGGVRVAFAGVFVLSLVVFLVFSLSNSRLSWINRCMSSCSCCLFFVILAHNSEFSLAIILISFRLR